IGSRDELREKSVQPVTKIIFVRHAEKDRSTADGELTETGKKQVSKLTEELRNEKFDAVYTSPAKRATQTVAEIAGNLNQEAVAIDFFGYTSTLSEFDKIVENIRKNLNIQNLAEAPEEELQKAFEDNINQFKEKFFEFLLQNQGKYLLVATHAEKLILIRHLMEGRKLKDAFAMTIPYGSKTTMYFTGDKLLNLHRPFIDEIKLKGNTGELTRITDVLDVWMDSASMPYASKHYPFENKEVFEANYPADFIVEYIAQTRAWFYVMHVISTSLFNKPSFKNVVTTGVIFGTDGRKMSKSYGNYPDPKEILEKYGAEPLRMYFMGSKIMVGEDINFDEEGLREQLKSFLLPLWNSYTFFVNYANLRNWEPQEELCSNIRTGNPTIKKYQWDHIPFNNFDNKLDEWIVAKLQETIRNITVEMDAYNIPGAVREFPKFISDLSNWYIRRSRERFAEGDRQAMDTLYYVLVELCKIIAPVLPFISEELYQNLVAARFSDQIKNPENDQQESVHLTDFPHADTKYLEKAGRLLFQMDKVREIVSLGQTIRVQNHIKVKQPLAEINVWSDFEPERNFELEDWMENLIKDELNIKKISSSIEELPDKKGWVKARHQDGNLEISLDLNLTEELIQQGKYREFVRQVQSLRKKSGLQLGDTINLEVFTDDQELAKMLNNLNDQVKSAVTAKTFTVSSTQVSVEKIGEAKEVKISGKMVRINITKI
ncbi:MAG TPA: class I tRNA ligase family protein, partial [Candidatus Dojkabacteria bacterium]|nr:class I tRNA ligase family protein [Candidatus Dojkabacteria bacterium]